LELLDSLGQFVYGNTAYYRVFRAQDTAPADALTPVLPAVFAGEVSRSAVLASAAATGMWRSEITLSTASQPQVWFRVAIFPVQNSEGEAPEFGVVYEEIQQEVESREALIRERNLLAIRSRQAQMGELLSMIAHQWRQPLTVVMSLIGNIQLKSRLGGLEPDYLIGKLERISQTVHFLSDTIDSFRNFYAPAKYKSREDLSFLARRALELVGPSLQKLGVHVEFDAPDEAVEATVFSGELVQVALELMTNARDALVSGSAVPLQLRLSVGRAGDHVFLKVANNGTPIPPEAMPRLYDAYYTIKDGATGTGLGLYMAKLIVENHHEGTLTAESRDGWTTFTCLLPTGGSL
jgi:signal transduction histidine kinase